MLLHSILVLSGLNQNSKKLNSFENRFEKGLEIKEKQKKGRTFSFSVLARRLILLLSFLPHSPACL
jgi:hypothetical protein